MVWYSGLGGVSTDLVVWSLCWKWLVSFWEKYCEVLLEFVLLTCPDMSSLTILTVGCISWPNIKYVKYWQKRSDNHHLSPLNIWNWAENINSLLWCKRKLYCLYKYRHWDGKTCGINLSIWLAVILISYMIDCSVS